MNEPTIADLRAAAKLGIDVTARLDAAVKHALGLDNPEPDVLVLETGARRLRAWDVTGSTGTVHRISQRVAQNLTNPYWKPGEVYYHCSCPGWRYKIGKGEYCKHVEQVLYNTGMAKEVTA